MSFGSREEGRFAVITLDDERLDASIAESFKSYIFEIIDGGGKALIVDLTNVKFMDSSGLGALVAGLKKLSGDGELILAGAQQAVKDLFDLTSMEKLFTIVNAVDDVVAGG